MLKYLPHTSHHYESIENFDHLLELLLFLQTPSVKTRLLFDIFDLNSDRFLSQKEITTILESAINQTGIKVKKKDTEWHLSASIYVTVSYINH